MHNSLHIRDRLRRTNADPFYVARRDPHRGVAVDPEAVPGPDDVRLDGAWRIEFGGASSDCLRAAADDLGDFMSRLDASTSSAASRTAELRIDPALPPRGFHLRVTQNCFSIAGGDPAGLWAGLAWFERRVRLRRGPFVEPIDITRTAAWRTQIHQGPWGGNYSVPDFGPEFLSDDSFRLYAHYGVNSMMIYGDLLCYARSAILPELDHPDADAHLGTLQDAARRAARFGVRFTYVIVGPKLRTDHPVFTAHPQVRGAGVQQPDQPLLHFLCSSNETVLEFYREQFHRLFSAVPELAGLVLITYSESVYHCRIWDGATVVHCEPCQALDPHAMVARLVNTIAQGAWSAQPNADVSCWIYTWSRGDRRELFKLLDPSVAVFHAVEKDGRYRKSGYTKHAWDYSIDCTGPTDDARALADFAHGDGRPLFVKTETGIGLEVFQFPYVPALQHLARKWEGVRSLRPAGVHQSWLFFGMFGSRAEELGLWAAYAPDVTADQWLTEMAIRDFGPAAAPLVVKAWREMSAAVTHLPCLMLGNYYIGPTFLGPAHPLVPHADDVIPEVFHGSLLYLQESGESLSPLAGERMIPLVLTGLAKTAHAAGITWEGEGDGWDIVRREFEAAARHAGSAVARLKQAAHLVRTDADRVNLDEESALCEVIQRTWISSHHCVEFLLARDRRRGQSDAEAAVAMRSVACAERDNALAARPLYARAPWLDLAARTDGRYSPCTAMIDAKVAWIDRWLGDGRKA